MRTQIEDWVYGPFDDLDFRTHRRRRGRPSKLTELARAVLSEQADADETYAQVGTFFDQVRIEDPTLDPRSFRSVGSRRITMKLEVPDEVADSVAEGVLRWLRAHARINPVVTGFVHVDNEDDPYTHRIVERAGLTANEFDWQIHGYYWAVLLTEGHLRRIDLEQLVSIDGVAIDWIHPNEMVLVTAAPTPSELTLDSVAAWRTALLPLLREGLPILKFQTVPGSTSYQPPEERPPVRSRQPKWLVERQPVPYYRYELFGHEGPATPVAMTVDDTIHDAARVEVSIDLAPGHDPAQCLDLVDGLATAWHAVWTSRLARPDHGTIISMTPPEFADSRRLSIHWSFEPGTADIDPALAALACSLGALQREFDHDLFRHITAASA